MAQVGFKVAGGVEAMNGTGHASHSFSLKEPAGWAMLWWVISVILIAMVFLAL